MKPFLAVVWFVIVLSNSLLLLAANEPSAEVRCLEVCHAEQHRYCAVPPVTCGRCLSGYTDIEGTCIFDDDLRQHFEVKVSQDFGSEVQQPDAGNTQNLVRGNLRIPQRSDLPTSGSPVVQQYDESTNDAILIAVVVSCSVAMVVGIIIAIVCWYKLSRMTKTVSEYEYPEYGSTYRQDYASHPPPYPGGRGDRGLAQSAQMYHYQHQKQQVLELERNNGDTYKASSEHSSDAENEPEYVVYETPGLATTGEMEVHNPLYMQSASLRSNGANINGGANNTPKHEQ